MSRTTTKLYDTAQEVLGFEDPLTLPKSYDLQRAKDAAARRQKRVGRVQRIEGFKRRTMGLFVPHSGTENSAVVDLPEHKLDGATAAAESRVKEKYKDSDVLTSRVDLWAGFAKQRSRGELRRKYRQFMHESASNAARIALRLDLFDGQITREAFAYDPDYRIDPEAHPDELSQGVLAYNCVLKYLVDLEAFTGSNPDLINRKNQRKWPQFRHHKDYRNRMEKAHEAVEPLAEHYFAEIVDEAYWSHASRNIFWVAANNRLDEYQRQKRMEKSEPETPPLEAYMNTPEYLCVEV